jgi:hypothetical protein
MLRRISLLAVLTAAGLAIAAPNYARAATTIGSNLAASPTSSFGGTSTVTVSHSGLPMASQAPGGDLAPSDGIVVRWRIKVGSVTSPAALRIIRPGSPGLATGAGTGPTVTPPANETTSYDVRLPIQAGDALGLDCCANPNFANFFATTAPGTSNWSPRLQDGETRPFGVFGPAELLINADIEADADHDGFGDETQDRCPTDATTQGPCPAAAATTPTTSAGKDPKCMKNRKKLKRQQTGLAKAGSEGTHGFIQGNIRDTKKRLTKLGC